MSLKYLILAAALSVAPLLASAQQDPVFADYETMRAELDAMIMKREVKDALLRFGGSSSMSEEDLENLETRMREIYPFDFRNVAVVDRNEMENGFAHELYAYWTGLRYLYVLVFLHQQENVLVSVNIRFNTDFYALIGDL